MKTFKTVVILFVFSAIYSCSNQPIEFEDFPYTTTYFSSQFPLRTMVLGDYKYENDNDGTFEIRAAHGGGYENKADVTVGFEITPTLIDNLYVGNTKLMIMPSEWYSLSNPNKMVIPKGTRQGGITVTLNDKFFSDPNSVNTYWAIPVKMITTTADSILSGKPIISNPDPRIAANWEFAPKNFTIFAVKFVNEWHGRYLLRGTSVCKDAVSDETIERVSYHARYLEANQVVSFTTSGRYQSRFSAGIRHKDNNNESLGNFDIVMDYNNSNNTATIAKHPSFKYNVTGSAKMVEGAESWGDIDRNVIYLDYKIEAGDRNIEIKDTLVFRDKNVKYEEFTPSVRP